MHVTHNQGVFRNEALFTLRNKKTGLLMQVSGEEKIASSCHTYDDALVKVIPSISGKFNKFEVIRCISRQ